MTSNPLRSGTGMILGKFMPPHLGHQCLVDMARLYVDKLTVLVCTLEREPIAGALRFGWMKAMFSDCNVVHITGDLPQEPSEHPDFWGFWTRTIREVIPTGSDFVFASEPYGYKLAEVLGARFIPVDPQRNMVGISATKIRQDPMAHWAFIPPVVRPYYVRRVCIYGPESTGKTTLAHRLAEYYRTVCVLEHARPLLDHKGGHCDPEDIPLIVRGQIASEDALALQANRLLICDTDPVTTTIWSEVLFGSCPAWVREEAARRQYDLYLLMDIDVPWVDDNQRFFPHRREEFLERCRRELDCLARPYVVIRGDWEQRFQAACNAVDELLSRKPAVHG